MRLKRFHIRRRTWAAAMLLATGVGVASDATIRSSAIARALPAREVDILLDVGDEYNLTGDALKLLLVIRKIENGGPGLEMGVGSTDSRHRARRHAGNPDLSLRTQARWAAGTIRSRYAGNLEAFARRYCPPKWSHWTGLARHWMNR